MKYIYTDFKYMFSRDLYFCQTSWTQLLTGILWLFVSEHVWSIYTGKKIFSYEKLYKEYVFILPHRFPNHQGNR